MYLACPPPGEASRSDASSIRASWTRTASLSSSFLLENLLPVTGAGTEAVVDGVFFATRIGVSSTWTVNGTQRLIDISF